MVEFVNAMGYSVRFEGIEGEEEVEILEAYRRDKGPGRRAARGALQLPPERPPQEGAESLRRLVARGRQDRRETQE